MVFVCQYFGGISIYVNILVGFLFLSIFWRDFYLCQYFGGISIFVNILAGFLYLWLDSDDAQSVLPSPPLARKLLFAGFLFLARRALGWTSTGQECKDIFRHKPQGSR